MGFKGHENPFIITSSSINLINVNPIRIRKGGGQHGIP
jgi:hypothetical protein